MKKRLLSRPALLLATALAFIACSNEDIQVNPVPEPQSTGDKVMVSITGTIDDENRDTRSSFVYGESLDNDGAAGESFQWNANDKINLRFGNQHRNLIYDNNVLSAPDNMQKGQTSTPFSGEITKYTGMQNIYAISPAIQIGLQDASTLLSLDTKVNYPLIVTQKGEDLSHLGKTDYMWAKLENFDLGDDGENLKNAQLNFNHLGAMLRFQIKNTSNKGNQYTLKRVTVREEGSTKILWDNAVFSFYDETPTLEKHRVLSSSSQKTIEVENAKLMSKNDSFDAYMMIPASPAGTDLTNSYKFYVEVEVTDGAGKELRREVEIEPAINGDFMKNGFAAGKRYYFIISIDEDNLKDFDITTVNVINGGELESLISNPESVERLVVTGKIDQRDFLFMRNGLLNLTSLDLSNVTIVAYETNLADAIPKGALSNKYLLRHISLPNNLKRIGESALYGCHGLMGTLTIPNQVTRIDNYAFAYCSGFTGDLIIPNSVTEIENDAFYRCSGFSGKLTLPVNDAFTTLNAGVFQYCSGFTGDLIIPDNVNTIRQSAFHDCIGFDGKLVLPTNDKFVLIGVDAFYGCSGLTGNLIIPASVKDLDTRAFANCSSFEGKPIFLYKNIFFGSGTFYGCTGFSGEFTIPKEMRLSGSNIFDHCKFTKFHLNWDEYSKIPGFSSDFFGQNINATITIPKGTREIYNNRGWWNIVERD